MPCTAKATAERGVFTTLRLLNITVVRSSNLILDVHIDTTISDFGAYDAPNAVALSEPQCTQ